MLVDAVRELPVEARFWYLMRERHAIYERRREGLPKPWTDDAVLQRYYFTNVYRELDKTTAWFRDAVRTPLRDELDVILATIIFRWFNWIPTGEFLQQRGWLTAWNTTEACEALLARQRDGHKIFTGAYMINPGASTREAGPKLNGICGRINTVWADRARLHRLAPTWTTLRSAHAALLQYPGLGNFSAYEIVCDLRFTRWLEGASDVRTWANPGPGAIRGFYRLLGRPVRDTNVGSLLPISQTEWSSHLQRLIEAGAVQCPELPPLEARDVEGMLCEFDKYDRGLMGVGGSLKRRYPGI